MTHPDYIKCSDCGEEYHRKSPHDCPGDPQDRIGDLRERIGALEEKHKALLEVLLHWTTLYGLATIRDAVEKLLMEMGS